MYCLVLKETLTFYCVVLCGPSGPHQTWPSVVCVTFDRWSLHYCQITKPHVTWPGFRLGVQSARPVFRTPPLKDLHRSGGKPPVVWSLFMAEAQHQIIWCGTRVGGSDTLLAVQAPTCQSWNAIGPKSDAREGALWCGYKETHTHTHTLEQ